MTITCHKCGGLLAAERHLDFYSRSTRWKCLNCGRSRLEDRKSRALWSERRAVARASLSLRDRRNP